MLGNPIRFIDPDGKAPTDWPPSWESIKEGARNAVNNVVTFVGATANAWSSNQVANAPGTRRSLDSYGEYETAAQAGQAFGDALSVATGVVEMVVGGSATASGVALAPETGGASLVLSAEGAAVTAHGFAVTQSGLQNLLAGDNNQGSGKGRGSNNRRPDSRASGDGENGGAHSVFNDKGNTTYHPNSRNPSGFDEVKRVDTKGKGHRIGSGENIPTPHVHEKGQDVRRAEKGKDY